jgi:hypothetical protein
MLNISGNKEGKIIARAMSVVISRAIIDSYEGQHICTCNKCIQSNATHAKSDIMDLKHVQFCAEMGHTLF